MKVDDLTEYGIPEEIISSIKGRGIIELEPIQVRALERGLLNDMNMLISAPTSSGKTLIGELALIKNSIKGKGCFYVVSHKALAEEKYRIFSETYKNWFNVAITTGDRSSYDNNLGGYGLVIATYEKLSNLLITNPDLLNSVNLVVVDEIQILGDEKRGSRLETLLIKLKEKSDIQLVCLSATIPKPEELGEWLKCDTILEEKRTINLKETLWCRDKIISKDFNTKDFKEEPNTTRSMQTSEIVQHLKQGGYFPLIVFCMTKKRAEELANGYFDTCEDAVNDRESIDILNEMNEGTPASRKLMRLLSRGVGFHTSDLSQIEKEVVESSFLNSRIPIIFSTSTLSTGINLPAKTILIDDCIRWNSEDIEVYEYINMAGRAGRRGFQENGQSIIVARNKSQEIGFMKYLNHDLKDIASKLNKASHGFRYHILHMIYSNSYNTVERIFRFFESSFLAFKHRNESGFNQRILKPIIQRSIEFLLEKGLVRTNHLNEYELTEYGRICVKKQILPETMILLRGFSDSIKEIVNESNFDDHIFDMIYLSTLTDEFNDGNTIHVHRRERGLFSKLDLKVKGMPFDEKNVKAANVLTLFSNGTSYDNLSTFEYVTPGKLKAAADVSSWIVESLSDVLELPVYNLDSNLIKKIRNLSNRIKFGVPESSVELARVFFESNVRCPRRSISIKLADNGIDSISKTIDLDIDELTKMVGPKNASSIRDGIMRYVRNENQRFRILHENRTKNLGKDVNIITNLYVKKGRDFEIAVHDALRSIEIDCTMRDVGHAESEPDLLIMDGDNKIPVECKTKDDENKTISSSEAFDIFGKGLNYNDRNLVTVGKPLFSQKAIDKGYENLTLLLHICLAEMVIKVWEKKMTKEDVMGIIKKGGYIKIEQI